MLGTLIKFYPRDFFIQCTNTKEHLNDGYFLSV